MTDKKKKYTIAEIVDAAFGKKYAKESGERFRDSFERWIVDPRDEQEKDHALRSNWERFLKERADRWSFLSLGRYNAKNREGRKQPTRPLGCVALRVAAVVIPIMLLVGGYIYFEVNSQPKEVRIVKLIVPNGVTHGVDLPDGSEMTVNSGSELRYPQTQAGKERVVELTGEAYFAVATDKDKPFVVKTDWFTVTVLGTMFNVEAYPEREYAIVSLDEGSVKVETIDNAQYTLKPGEEFVYHKESRSGEVMLAEKNSEQSAWRDGMLVIRDMKLPEILKMLERKYNITVETVGELGDTGLITMTFSKDDKLDHVIRVLNVMMPGFDYTIDGRILTIKRTIE